MWILIKLKDNPIAAGGVALILILCLLSPYVMAIGYFYYCTYKDEVEVVSSECLGFVYANNADYVNFAVELEFDDEPAVEVGVYTSVYDEEGELVGYLSHTFKADDLPSDSEETEDGNVVFKPDSTLTLYFNIHHKRGKTWDENEIITKLYRAYLNGNLENYTFETEIASIVFENYTSVIDSDYLDLREEGEL